MLRRLLSFLMVLSLALAPASCGGGDEGGGGATPPQPAASVDEVQAAAERATGMTLSLASVPASGADAGIAALLVSGADAQEGQRLLVAVGSVDRPNDIDESLKAELGSLAGVDVNATSAPSGWGTKVIRGQGSPVFILYWAEAGTKEDLEALDRSEALKSAMTPFGFSE